MDVCIYPLNTGFIRLDKGAYITPGEGYGTEVDVPAWAFYVTDGKEKYLVDTGMSETKTADWHHRGSYQPDGFRIDERLRALGVTPEEIQAVFFTHLHWDHCSNMRMFSRAKFFVHARELAFARDPHPLYYKSYESPKLGAVAPFDGATFETVDGEFRYNDFITLFPTPGHCPGHQSVCVQTSHGAFVIAGDAVFADENLKPDRHRNLPFTPMGRYVDVFEMYESMERIFARADHILTGHGMGVSQKPVYS